MASWKEIERVRKGVAEARSIAAGLLKFNSRDMTEWEASFLESIARHPDDDPLTTRQVEKLLQIRDDLTFVTETYNGLSVQILIEKIHLARADLSDDDEEWIVKLRERNGRSIARKHVGRLMNLAGQLVLVDSEDEAALTIASQTALELDDCPADAFGAVRARHAARRKRRA